MAVSFKELGTLDGAFEPLPSFLYLVAEHGEEPYLPALKPDKLVGVEHVALSVQAGKVTPMLVVLRLGEPKGNHVVK